jgi:hypothetical protein
MTISPFKLLQRERNDFRDRLYLAQKVEATYSMGTYSLGAESINAITLKEEIRVASIFGYRIEVFIREDGRLETRAVKWRSA